jgi:two-component system, LytTR family, sensor kinase
LVVDGKNGPLPRPAVYLWRMFSLPMSKNTREILFQVVLHLIVLVSYASQKRHPEISVQELVYFLNYTFIAFVINYGLLPRYLYPKKYTAFFTGLFLLITYLVLSEELVLERIFFPDTRALRFPGVFYTLVQVLPVICILSGFKFAWDAFVKQQEVESLRASVQESEMQFLKSQINPHFLFNNLNNLYAYAMENSPKTPEIILELSGVLRYMLYECREDYVPLKKEVEQLHNFIKISELQVESRGKVRFSANNIPANFKIAPLILTVFIENAFKHSTASQADQIEIDIDLQVSEAGVLQFSCVNSFGELSNTDYLTAGIGLENVRKRLKWLYPQQHTLDIQKTKHQYLVRLTLELAAF